MQQLISKYKTESDPTAGKILMLLLSNSWHINKSAVYNFHILHIPFKLDSVFFIFNLNLYEMWWRICSVLQLKMTTMLQNYFIYSEYVTEPIFEYEG